MTRIYLKIIKAVEKYVPPKFQPLWNHPAEGATANSEIPVITMAHSVPVFVPGPKTVFFWAPLFKWGLVIASLGDLKRPPESISVYQSASLAVSGAIWSRYCLVIYPVNYNLFLCNVFVSCSGIYQMIRALSYQRGNSEGESKLKQP